MAHLWEWGLRRSCFPCGHVLEVSDGNGKQTRVAPSISVSLDDSGRMHCRMAIDEGLINMRANDGVLDLNGDEASAHFDATDVPLQLQLIAAMTGALAHILRRVCSLQAHWAAQNICLAAASCVTSRRVGRVRHKLSSF